MNRFYHKALELDQNDKLAHFREYFEEDTKMIYLDGNSLGKLPKRTIELMSNLVRNQWGGRLIRSWNEHWMELPNKIAAKIAKVLGARYDEVFVGDSTSVNLYKLAYASLYANQSRTKVLTDSLNFPTDLYILQGLVAQQFKQHSLEIVQSRDEIGVEESALKKALDNNTALLVLSHVLYKSAFMYDMKSVNALAHKKGALVIWDLSHSVGAVPIALNKSGADMAVGCTYKYLNGGPGAPSFLYVRKDLQEKLMNPIWAWFSHQHPFDFGMEYEAKDTIQRFASGTPSVLSLAGIETGVDITLEAGMDNIRAKSVSQSDFLIELIEAFLVPLGFSIASPLKAGERGSHISIQHAEGYRINRAMIEPYDGSRSIIPDFRPPNNIRLGIAPLYNSYMELFECVNRIQKIVEEEQYRQYSEERLRVT